MAELILKIIGSGLHIWDKKTPTEAQKLRQRYFDLRKQWDEEKAKGSKRNDAKYTAIYRELLDLGELFAAALNSKDP